MSEITGTHELDELFSSYALTDEDKSGVLRLVDDARDYLASFDWVDGIRSMRWGVGLPPKVGVLLAEIYPADDEIDRMLWVIVGDVPPAYLVTEDALDPSSALEIYCELRDEWVQAVRAGDAAAIGDTVMPTNVAPSPSSADALSRRIGLLRRLLHEGQLEFDPR